MRNVIMALGLLFAVSTVHADIGDNNIARGLAPTTDQHIKVLATYAGQFRVLARKDYQNDPEARFSPMDLAVSSGPLASGTYYQSIEASQANRFLSINIKPLPFSPKQLREHVDNIHVIPGSEQVAQQLQQVQRGDLVQLKGYLVEVGDKRSSWRSSLSNDAVGAGACKVMRIESITWIEKADATGSHGHAFWG